MKISSNHQGISIMQMASIVLAFQGAQLLVAKNDTINFHQAYGYHTYEKHSACRIEMIFITIWLPVHQIPALLPL